MTLTCRHLDLCFIDYFSVNSIVFWIYLNLGVCFVSYSNRAVVGFLGILQYASIVRPSGFSCAFGGLGRATSHFACADIAFYKLDNWMLRLSHYLRVWDFEH
jgi:hypothetical protein